MERLNSGEYKIILRIILCFVIVGLTKSGRAAWQEEDTRNISVVCWFFRSNSCTSEIFKDIQDAVSLILLYRTMSLFRATSSNALVMSDVQSIHIPSSIRDWYQEAKFWATDRQYSFCLWIPCSKTIRILDTIDLNAPRHAQYMHKAQKKHQNTVYWSTSILLWRKDWRYIRRDRTPSSFTIHSQPIVSQSLLRRKLEKSFTKKVFESPRPPPKISLRNDWMKEVGPEVAGHAAGSQPTQPNPNPIYRAGRPVGTEQTSRSSAQEIDTRFSLDCENTNLFVERLEKDKDTDKDADADRVRTVRPVGHWSPSSRRCTSTSGCLDCHMLLWNNPKILVFVNSWRRSRVTLIDKIFKPTYNKTMPTTHLVKNQRRWLRTWAM